MKPHPTLRARNGHVVLEIRMKGNVNGVIMPEQAEENNEYIVVSMGPLVKDLRLGDKVRCAGQRGVNWDFIPNTNKKMLSIDEKSIFVVEGTVLTPEEVEARDRQVEFTPELFPDAGEYEEKGTTNPGVVFPRGKSAKLPPPPKEYSPAMPLEVIVNGEKLVVTVNPLKPEEFDTLIADTCKIKWGAGNLKKVKDEETKEVKLIWEI